MQQQVLTEKYDTLVETNKMLAERYNALMEQVKMAKLEEQLKVVKLEGQVKVAKLEGQLNVVKLEAEKTVLKTQMDMMELQRQLDLDAAAQQNFELDQGRVQAGQLQLTNSPTERMRGPPPMLQVRGLYADDPQVSTHPADGPGQLQQGWPPAGGTRQQHQIIGREKARRSRNLLLQDPDREQPTHSAAATNTNNANRWDDNAFGMTNDICIEGVNGLLANKTSDSHNHAHDSHTKIVQAMWPFSLTGDYMPRQRRTDTHYYFEVTLHQTAGVTFVGLVKYGHGRRGRDDHSSYMIDGDGLLWVGTEVHAWPPAEEEQETEEEGGFFRTRDVIGCGIRVGVGGMRSSRRGGGGYAQIYFTKNGRPLEGRSITLSANEAKGDFYPTVNFGLNSATVEANFGATHFRFDPNSF